MQHLKFDDVLEALGALSPSERDAVIKEALADNGHMVFVPSPGPQTEAYHSPADVLLYGGQAAGGKTALVLGLAFTAHQRSLIMRRRYVDLGAITEEAIRINGTRDGFNGSSPPKLRTKDGRHIDFGAATHPGDEDSWRGQPHDFLGLDEATQFLESQVRFLFGWVRTTVPGQRTRVVMATNPPVSSVGDWIVGMFRPWLDLTHPKPAKAGEIRWYISDEEGRDLEVDGPGPVQRDGREFLPKSRTFIPSALSDNPYLAKTNYRATLDSLPEPLRSAVRDGNFMAARADAEHQVIPTAWVIAAQDRWRPDGWKDYQMTAIGFDPCGGGKDKSAIALRHGCWYAPVVTEQGTTDDGAAIGVATLIKLRRDNAPIILDVGGGYGNAAKVRMTDNSIAHLDFNGSAATQEKALASGLPFINTRAMAWWRFREALDPAQEGGSQIALPPDPELRADLTTPMMVPRVLEMRGAIQIESKLDIRNRLGRSPDKGDAVVMAWAFGHRAALRAEQRRAKMSSTSYNPNRSPRITRAHQRAMSGGHEGGEQG